MINEKELLNNVAGTLLDTPVKITIDIKPQNKWQAILQFIRLKAKRRTFAITGATLRTMIRVSNMLLWVDVSPKPIDGEKEWSYEAIQSQSERMADIIATAIHNKKTHRPDALVELILDNFTALELKAVCDIVVEKLNTSHFMNTIASVRSTSLLKTEASPIPTEEIIASGEQLTDLSNIFASATILS